jgi:hypothetical protein
MPHSMRRSSLLFLACSMLVACSGDRPKAEPWIGKTFLLDTPAIGSSNWTKPSGLVVGNLGNYGVPQFLFGVAAASGDDLVITLAAAQQRKQDMCSPTTQLTVSGATYPNSTITAAAVPMRIVSKDPTNPWHVMATIQEVSFKDILPGLASTATSRFVAVFDFTELAPFVWPGGTAEAICQAAGLGGDPCQICPFNGTPYCMTFEAVQISAQEAAIPIKGIAPRDIPTACSAQR